MRLGLRNGDASTHRTLLSLRRGEEAILETLDLPARAAARLMELGFLPGVRVVAASSAPGGDPRVYRVDGAEVALRRETAACIRLRADGDCGDGAA